MQERGNGVSDEIFTRPAALLVWLYDPRHAGDPPGLGDDVACPVSRAAFGIVCSIVSCAGKLEQCNMLHYQRLTVRGETRHGQPQGKEDRAHCKHTFSAAKSRIARHGSPELSSEPPRNGPTQDVIFIIPSFRDVPCEDIHRPGLGGAGPGIGPIDTLGLPFTLLISFAGLSSLDSCIHPE